MEIDIEIGDILREVIVFLECLRDAQLPLMLENLREKLLARSENILSIVTTAQSSSSEAYLDMKVGPKSISLNSGPKSETDSEEYVGMENSSHQVLQDYYEIFEPKTAAIKAIEPSIERNNDREESQTLIKIYKNLSATQSRGKCHKYGPLYKKESRKLFLSENRACWAVLLGTHLLIYRSERHNRPYAVYPIRGYMARPAPNLIPRDRQKSESAFEMYCPGSETLQFIARTRKEMNQWIAKVHEVGCGDESKTDSNMKINEKDKVGKKALTYKREENDGRRRGGGKSPVAKSKLTTGTESKAGSKSEVERKDTVAGSPPPLPARIPLRFPSSPSSCNSTAPPCETAVADEDDDDEIYYKIEDLKTPYQNMMLSRKRRTSLKRDDADGYDDVSKETKEEGSVQQERDDPSSLEETYDDISTRVDAVASVEEKNRNDDRAPIASYEETLYDDIDNLTANKKSIRNWTKNQNDTPSKLYPKKSFLERVWNRKESSSKSDKRLRSKVSKSPLPSSTVEEMPTYDDISDLTLKQKSLTDDSEELPEYKSPPPPRPIYAKPPIVSNPGEAEEIYDDVSACREQYNKNNQTNDMQESHTSAKEASSDAVEPGREDIPSQVDTEYYQSPRSDPYPCDVIQNEQKEELYDDIALWADFTAKRRDKRDCEGDKPTTDSPDKKFRNPFAINRKSSTSDVTGECEEPEDSIGENNNGSVKRNTFQRLISKMENSLAKVSARGPPSFPMRPSTASNNS